MTRLHWDPPVQDAQQLLHAAPRPDLSAGVRILTQLHEHPDRAPQQLHVLRVQEAKQNRHPVTLTHLLPDALHGAQQPQQLRAQPDDK